MIQVMCFPIVKKKVPVSFSQHSVFFLFGCKTIVGPCNFSDLQFHTRRKKRENVCDSMVASNITFVELIFSMSMFACYISTGFAAK